MDDKQTEILLEALKQGMASPAEQRLYRAGKFAGLFPGRTGAGGETAAIALRDGLVEIVRTESKGKVIVEWARPTPKGVQFVYEHESPIRALEDLREVLRSAPEGVPVWIAEMRRELQALTSRLAEEAERWTHRFEGLATRVEEALRRSEAGKTHLADGPAGAVAWGVEALAYLDRRRDGGSAGDCPLPELFSAVRQHHPDLSLRAFQEGLRRLRDRQALFLMPFLGQPGELPEPEFALPEGPALLYYAGR